MSLVSGMFALGDLVSQLRTEGTTYIWQCDCLIIIYIPAPSEVLPVFTYYRLTTNATILLAACVIGIIAFTQFF